jgi:hypothetical protein
MRKMVRWRMISAVLLAMLMSVPALGAGEVLFPYRPRGDHYEGVWNVIPISGVDFQLTSVCAALGDYDSVCTDSVPGYVHLAFVVPDTSLQIDITIRGPSNYLLDRVERDFHEGFNVFAWDSRVVDGLGISLEELEPVVSAVGGSYIPCFICREKPSLMPDVDDYRVSFVANTEGTIKYFVRDADTILDQGEFPVSPDVAVDVEVPAGTQCDHMDLIAILEYPCADGTRTARQSFPILGLQHTQAADEGN